MTAVELRDTVIQGLSAYLGRPVILSDQTAPEPEPPFIYVSVLAAYPSPNGGANYAFEAVPSEDPDFTFDLMHRRIEQPTATYSFVAVSQNRVRDGSKIYGDDEAQALAEKAQGWFLHVGEVWLDDRDICVVEVYDVTNQTAFEIEEVDRCYGFSVRLRYVRVDARRDPNIEKIFIVRKER